MKPEPWTKIQTREFESLVAERDRYREDAKRWARQFAALERAHRELREYWGDTLGVVMEVGRLREALWRIVIDPSPKLGSARQIAREALGAEGAEGRE